MKERKGYHVAGIYIANILWDRLCADARHDGSIVKAINRRLAEVYGISLDALPPPEKAGPKPRKRRK